MCKPEDKTGHNYVGGYCLDCEGSQNKPFKGGTKKGREYEAEKEQLQKHKIDYSYQELGVEMQKKFGNIWWLFHKYPEDKIREAYKACEVAGVYNIKYLIGVLKK